MLKMSSFKVQSIKLSDFKRGLDLFFSSPELFSFSTHDANELVSPSVKLELMLIPFRVKVVRENWFVNRSMLEHCCTSSIVLN